MSRRHSPATVVAIAAAILLLAVAARPAAATLIVIPNASFQNPDLADTVFNDTIPNWTFATTGTGIMAAGVWDPGTSDGYTLSGGNNTDIDGPAGPSIGGQAAYIYLEQAGQVPQPLSGHITTAAPIALVESDYSYDLTVALGRATGVLTGDVELQLLISKFPIASIVVPAASIPQNGFADFTVNLTTFTDYPFAGSELHARIVHTYSGPGAASLDIDNVRFDVTKVPEPSSASVALLALAAMASRTRRARRGNAHD